MKNIPDEKVCQFSYIARLLGNIESKKIITALERGGEMCTNDLVRYTGMSQPNTSTKLRALEECGAVIRHKTSRYNIVSLNKSMMKRYATCINKLTEGLE